MMYKIVSLNIRGLNSSRKREGKFFDGCIVNNPILFSYKKRILHLKQLKGGKQNGTWDVGTWSGKQNGKIAYSHGSSHSRGVMILFKPRLDVGIEKISTDNYGRCVLVETILGDKKTVFVNITTQARFKCVPTFCGSIIIHIFTLLFFLIEYS